MTREEILSRQSQKYRDFREKCGVKDPILLDEVDEAFYLGAEWADKTMLKKACKWLKENVDGYLQYPFAEINIGNLIKDFKKAMEE